MPVVGNKRRGSNIFERKEDLRYSKMELTTSTVTKSTSAHRGRVQREEAGTDRAYMLATDNCDGEG